MDVIFFFPLADYRLFSFSVCVVEKNGTLVRKLVIDERKRRISRQCYRPLIRRWSINDNHVKAGVLKSLRIGIEFVPKVGSDSKRAMVQRCMQNGYGLFQRFPLNSRPHSGGPFPVMFYGDYPGGGIVHFY